MGTGWRRAFCTTIPTTTTTTTSSSDSPAPPVALRQLHPNPSTTSTNNSVIDNNLNITTPRLIRCKTTNKNHHPKSSSWSSSPRSPFSIFFKTSFGFSISRASNYCGVCLQSLKSGHYKTTAIFTAECSHAFHFPCISRHVMISQENNLVVCPVCKTTWRRRDGANSSFLNLQSNQILLTPRSTYNSVQSNVRYHDDEPLRTPRAAAVTAREEEKELDDDVNEEEEEEFKGFFVNNNPSSSAEPEREYYCKQVEVMLMPELVAIISSTQSHHTYAVVLKVKAPPPPPPLGGTLCNSRRAPIDLVAVLDVSATMAGAKLQMLKRAMHLVISSLGSSDRLSIVAAFSASPKRLLALRKMSPGGQRSARRIIDQLACSRGTCAAAVEALKKATKVLQDRRERNPVATIILLSDGHEEHVTQDTSNRRDQRGQTSSSHTRFAHVEIPVVRTLEKTGEPAEDAFTKCVGGLLSVVAQDLRIELGVAVGSDPVEITAVYSCNGNPMVLNAGSIRFGDLYAEEEREVLVELRVPRSKSNTGHHVLSGRCCYRDPATQEVIYGGEKALVVARAQKVERLRCLFIATRAVAESRLLVEHNKVRMAHHLLSSARDLLMQSGEGRLVKGLECELVKVEGVMVDEPEKVAKVAVMKKPVNRVRRL